MCIINMCNDPYHNYNTYDVIMGTIEHKKKKIHKSNCVNQVRFTITDQLGNTVTVCGKYAYEWTININKDGMVIQTSFKNRRKALNELERLVGKKIR